MAFESYGGSFLNSKYYGQPYMPSSLQELVFLVKLKVVILYHSIVAFAYENYFNCDVAAWNWVELVKTVIFAYVAVRNLNKIFVFVRGHGIWGTIKVIKFRLGTWVFSYFLSLPPVKSKVNQELEKTIDKIEEELMKNDTRQLYQAPKLPRSGLDSSKVLEELDKLQLLKHSDWKKGRVSGAVYHGGDSVLELQSQAYHKYSIANQLHPDVFPGVRKMEAEVVSMVLGIFNAPKEACGSTTSGGTESLLLTGLAAREYGKRYKGIREPEVIAPITVHAGIEKACYYFGMTLHKVDVDPKTFKVDIKKVRRLINSNTVLLVGSAPNFPHGIIDDIEQLSALATRYKIPLHVDACLGSFIVPFLQESQVHGDKDIPIFDFRNPGVTSISCDTHKYGFAPKGSSIIMYRNTKLRECQYYVLTDWTGGMYGSPTLAGSRPGALMAGCWATLVHLGRDNYVESCRQIVGAAMKLKHAIQTHPVLSKHLQILGDPIGPVVSFAVKTTSKDKLNPYVLGDTLTEKGWHFSTLQNPAALHFALTKLTVPVIDELIADLAETVQNALLDTSAKKVSDVGSLYGVAGSVTTTGVADKVIVAFLDTLYKV